MQASVAAARKPIGTPSSVSVCPLGVGNSQSHHSPAVCPSIQPRKSCVLDPQPLAQHVSHPELLDALLQTRTPHSPPCPNPYPEP